ncbi:hypothetical protein EI94DRAFT_1576407, partial [Lactarius quietus]
QRKTGLFKKAYELGVLCSVDVAVIIFERKHGHPDKLFQYCSTDIDSLIQRQIRFDGERDLRTPHDFTGSANLSRLDDMGEDDDDVDADDSPTAPYIRHDGIKGKSIPDSGKPSGAKPKTTPEVRPAFAFASYFCLTHPSIPGRLPSPPPRNGTFFFTNSPRLRRPPHPPVQPPRPEFVILLCRTLSKST